MVNRRCTVAVMPWGADKSMVTIYGECVSGTTRAPVTISELKPEVCVLAPEDRQALAGELELWIGAVGPFGITAEQAESGVTARFKTPLEQAIIAHFNA